MMKKLVLAACVLAAVACHRRNAPQNMSGRLHISPERITFSRQGTEYYLIDEQHLLSAEIEALRREKRSYNVDADLCISARELTKKHNGGNGFGHLGKYGKAVAVEGLC